MDNHCSQILIFSKRHLISFLLLVGFAHSFYYEDGCSDDPFVNSAVPLVRTSTGSLVGKYLDVPKKKTVAAFLGVPYAHSPVNEKRFLKPIPLDHWEGILDATVKPAPCMQYSSRNFSWIPKSTASEDCLYLNIWTPAKCCCSPEEMRPVLVFIFGGGFYAGSTDMDIYDGSMFASQSGAVIVSINYRVGIFGFLNSGTVEAPGNVGLIDQNLALGWIKSNIGFFGGDPNSITIMGESAGAWSVSLHMLSPKFRHLFNAAIMQSGTAHHLNLVDSPETAYFKANTFAKAIGCLADNSSINTDPEVMDCIKSKQSLELATYEDLFTSKVPMFFLPSYGNSFLPESPLKAIKNGHIAPVDILIGSNRNETTIFLNYIMTQIFRLDSEPLLNLEAAKQVLEGLFSTVPNPTVNEIYEQYFQNVSDIDSQSIVDAIEKAFSDYIFNCPTYFFAEKAKSAYMYLFTHRSTDENLANWLGVPHFSEVSYIFGVPTKDPSCHNSEDATFSEDLIEKWSSFARMGHPLGDKRSDNWPAFTKKNPVAYNLGPGQEGITLYPRKDACEFWRPYIAPEDS